MNSKKRQAATSDESAASLAVDSSHESKALTKRRKWLFRLTALVILPGLLLGVTELVLRVIGYGYPTTFFVTSPVAGRGNLVENRQFSRRYFSPELMRIPKPLAFSPAKPPKTLRIFVFGESAAEGDPAPAFGFARILQVLLRDQYPDRDIEIINTSVTAINSHVICPVARECAGYSGDFWVLYVGNNEVVGPFGSGTVFGAQVPPLWLIRTSTALKTTRLAQLLDSGLQGVTRRSPQSWQGMEMFLNQQVARDDPRMTTVYSHFEKNLLDIVACGVRSGAKVVVSTVGSNLRDCPPLGSLHQRDLSMSQTEEWERCYQAGVTLEGQGEYDQAINQYRRASELDDQFADLYFRLGRCYAALGQREQAWEHYTLARDWDTLRFRADSRINAIIRGLAQEWPTNEVRLADVEAALRRSSVEGVPGHEWFFEHVHLTFAGNYLVARTLAEQITQLYSDATSTDSSRRPFLSLEECSRRLGLADCERLRMAEEMSRRTSRPPFTHQLDHAAQMVGWERTLVDLRERDRTNFQASTALYEQALSNADDDWYLHDNFAGALLLHGDPTNAMAHWQRVTQLLPHRVETYDLIGSILIEEGQLADAAGYYQQVLRIQPDFVEGLIGLGRCWLGLNREAAAITQLRRAVRLRPRDGRTHNHLGVALLQVHDTVGAEREFREAAQVEPDFLPARLNLGSTLLAERKPEEAIACYQELVRSYPDNGTVRMALGKAFAKEGRWDEAIQHYAEVVRLQPDDFDARVALGSALIRMNRLPQAEEHFATAVRLHPDSVECRVNYGGILASQGRTREACIQFEEVLRMKPEWPPAHLNLAIALAEQKEFDEAALHLREVLRLEPGNARAQQLLQNIQGRQASAQ